MGKLSIALALIKSRYTNKRVPLFVSWLITNRCNYQCAYCKPSATKELTTEEVFSVIGDLAALGTKKISFSGGEPFLRRDLGLILDRCKRWNIVTSVNSNGSLVPQRINEILGMDILDISLDGPEKVHDSVRGAGSFQDVIRAVEAARSCGIRTAFSVTLSKLNLDCLDFFLNIAKDYKSLIWFQPSENNVLRGEGPNLLVQPEKEYKEFIGQLIIAKRTNPYVANSLSGLKHLSLWPHFHLPMKCYGGQLFCRIDANGDVKICSRANGTKVAGNVLEGGFRKAFENIKLVVCDLCWCARRIEFNYALAFDLRAVCDSVKTGYFFSKPFLSPRKEG